jgi:hypothetical protein
VQKSRKEYMAVPRFPLTSVLRLAVNVAMGTSPSAEHHVLRTWFSQSHTQREQGSSALGVLGVSNREGLRNDLVFLRTGLLREDFDKG